MKELKQPTEKVPYHFQRDPEFYNDMRKLDKLSAKLLNRAKLTSYNKDCIVQYKSQKSTVKTVIALLTDIDYQTQLNKMKKSHKNNRKYENKLCVTLLRKQKIKTEKQK